MEDLKKYAGKNVLILGGLGFIGSNLAIKFVESGANVAIADACLEGYGANLFNISPVVSEIDLHEVDIRDKSKLVGLIKRKEVIFNMAGQVNPGLSNQNPHLDIDLNCNTSVNVLQCCLEKNRDCRIVFPGSRMQYGEVRSLPVSEKAPFNPSTIYGANKVAAEMYHRIFHSVHGLDTVVARLTNPFGPRAQINNPGYSVANWFVGQALHGEELRVYGKGNQLRDYIYIDDAVDALATLGVSKNVSGGVFNVGSGRKDRLIDFVNAVALETGAKISHVPWPENSKSIETGDFFADIGRIRATTGWASKVSLEEGVKKTIEYYREHYREYFSLYK